MDSRQKAEIQQIIREVVEQAVPAAVHHAVPDVVEQTLKTFGFTIEDAISMQEDMAHLRRLRKGSELIKGVTVKTCIGAFISGMIYLLCEGLRSDLIRSISQGGK